MDLMRPMLLFSEILVAGVTTLRYPYTHSRRGYVGEDGEFGECTGSAKGL